VILLISASCVARITGMSHQHPSRIFCVVIFGQKYLLLSEEQTISTGNPGGKINNFSELSVFSPLFQ
jgi:hypothetical protein